MFKWLRNYIRELFGVPKAVPTDAEKSAWLIDTIRKNGGHIGSNFSLYDSSIDISAPYLINIGDNVTITGARILTHDASLFKAVGYTKVGHVTIGNDVFISNGCIILPDTTIGDRVVVGAGVIVAKDVPSNSVIVGNPWRILCTYDEYVEKTRLQMTELPVIDKLPAEIKNSPEDKKRLIDAGRGFVK